MADEPQPVDLGVVTEQCYLRSLKKWCDAWRAGRSYEQAMAQGVVTRHISLDISHRHGWLKVTVTITTKHPHQSEVYFYRWQRAQHGRWLEVASLKV